MPKREIKILITAGPTWVALDSVRVISNISSGNLGLLLANQALKNNFLVTLVLGPAGMVDLPPGIRVIRFRFFDELQQIVKKELIDGDYDVVIFAAAVSDYLPRRKLFGKIKSGKKLFLELKPAPKIINQIKEFSPKSFLVAFKLEDGISDKLLISRACGLFNSCRAEIVIANRAQPYQAFILSKGKIIARASTRKGVSEKLFKILANLQRFDIIQK